MQQRREEMKQRSGLKFVELLKEVIETIYCNMEAIWQGRNVSDEETVAISLDFGIES